MINVTSKRDAIKIVSVQKDPQILFITYKSGFSPVSRTMILPKGLSSFDIQSPFINSVEYHTFPVSKKLSEGEHQTPPKGYPEDKDDYAVPEFYLFPIDTEEHVRAALSYFDKHAWKPEEHKKKAAKRILEAAKKFKIDVSEDSNVYKEAHSAAKSLADIEDTLNIISRMSMLADFARQEGDIEYGDERDYSRSEKYEDIIDDLFDLSIDHLAEEREELMTKFNELKKSLSKKIKNEDGKYFVYDHTGKKKLAGPYDSHKDAEKRLKEIEWFKEHPEKKNAEELIGTDGEF